jgi:hypothetical protein
LRSGSLFFGVTVEGSDSAEPTTDRGSCPTERLEVTTERLDVGAPRTEECDVSFRAPGDVLAEISAYASRVKPL